MPPLVQETDRPGDPRGECVLITDGGELLFEQVRIGRSDVTNLLQEVLSVGDSIGHLFFQRALDEAGQWFRYRVTVGIGWLQQHIAKNVLNVVSRLVERSGPGEELIENRSEGPDVRLGSHLGSIFPLFGRCVFRSAHHAVGRGQGLPAAHELGKAKIDDLHLVTGKHDVGGLQIPVVDLVRVRFGETGTDLLEPGENLVARKPASALDDALQVASVAVLHDDMGRIHSELEEPDDVGMVQSGGGPGFPDDALDELGNPVFSLENLHGAKVLEVWILAEEDLAHGAAAETAEDHVLPDQGLIGSRVAGILQVRRSAGPGQIVIRHPAQPPALSSPTPRCSPLQSPAWIVQVPTPGLHFSRTPDLQRQVFYLVAILLTWDQIQSQVAQNPGDRHIGSHSGRPQAEIFDVLILMRHLMHDVMSWN